MIESIRETAPRTQRRLQGIAMAVGLVALIHAGAIFGFFYAYGASVMFGLDQIGGSTAILAMQAINATVRNFVFAPAFFLTPAILALAALGAWTAGSRSGSIWFLLAAAIYFAFAFLPTLLVSVPMNDNLAAVPATGPDSAIIWSQYSRRWQTWNWVRTFAGGISLLAAGAGLIALGKASAS